MKARPLTATCQLQISGSGFVNATISPPYNLSEVIKKYQTKQISDHSPKYFINIYASAPLFCKYLKYKNDLWSNVSFRTELNIWCFTSLPSDKSYSQRDGSAPPTPTIPPNLYSSDERNEVNLSGRKTSKGGEGMVPYLQLRCLMMVIVCFPGHWQLIEPSIQVLFTSALD